MDLARRTRPGDRGAHLEHVGAEDLLLAGREVVGVVLHERRAAGESCPHRLHHPHERGRLPVALAGEAVAVGHQPLHGEARKLLQPVQVLEGVGERFGAERVEQPAQSRLDPRRVAERLAPRAAGRELRGKFVRRLVLARQSVDLCVRNRVHCLDQVADAVTVHRDAEPELRPDLVALGDRDLAHVVAEPRDPQPLRRAPAAGGARPGADPVANPRLRPVSDDRLADESHPRLHERELAVAVRGLIEVHEVHVDLAPREVAVVLGVQVEEGPLQGPESRDPHLRGRERVHPCDHADAAGARAGLDDHGVDRLGRGRDGLSDDSHGNLDGLVESGGDLRRVRLDGAELLGAVHVLAAADEPGLEVSERVRRHRWGPPRAGCGSSRSSAR